MYLAIYTYITSAGSSTLRLLCLHLLNHAHHFLVAAATAQAAPHTARLPAIAHGSCTRHSKRSASCESSSRGGLLRFETNIARGSRSEPMGRAAAAQKPARARYRGSTLLSRQRDARHMARIFTHATYSCLYGCFVLFVCIDVSIYDTVYVYIGILHCSGTTCHTPAAASRAPPALARTHTCTPTAGQPKLIVQHAGENRGTKRQNGGASGPVR